MYSTFCIHVLIIMCYVFVGQNSSKIGPKSGMVPGGPQALLGHLWAKTFVCNKSSLFTTNVKQHQTHLKLPDIPQPFCFVLPAMWFTSRPCMTAQADPPEAKCSYIDPLSLMFHQALTFLNQNILVSICHKIVISTPVVSWIVLEPCLIYLSKKI